jgi:hypothetical protein
LPPDVPLPELLVKTGFWARAMSDCQLQLAAPNQHLVFVRSDMLARGPRSRQWPVASGQ